MKKLVGLLPWVGSKRQLRDQIIPRIPQHTCYVEPFAGGAWVYLGKEQSEVEVLNDINGDLVNLYKAVRQHTEQLYDAIWYMLPSRADYQASREILKKPAERAEGAIDIERAALFYHHIKNAFGGRFGSGFGFSKNTPPRSIIANDLLISLRDRLRHTYIENLPYDRLIQNYDSRDTFLYLDPPYIVECKSKCYQFDFEADDHAALAKCLRSVKAKFLLSYGDHPTIRDLYRGFKMDTLDVTYTLSGKAQKKRELLISNY